MGCPLLVHHPTPGLLLSSSRRGPPLSLPSPPLPSLLRIPDALPRLHSTAALPWMTGTAVNPLLRAVYLARRKERHQVTLCLPWVEPDEQHHIFSKGVVYERKEQLEQYIREWVRVNLGFTTQIKIAWWDGIYLPQYGSIFPLGIPPFLHLSSLSFSLLSLFLPFSIFSPSFPLSIPSLPPSLPPTVPPKYLGSTLSMDACCGDTHHPSLPCTPPLLVQLPFRDFPLSNVTEASSSSNLKHQTSNHTPHTSNLK